MSNVRSDKSPGIFAKNAQTAIPMPPVVGVSYRDSVSGLDNIEDGWSYETRVMSQEHNEFLFRETTLVELIDKTGILGWCESVNYDSGYAVTIGSNKGIYLLIQDSGPGTPAGAKDPISSPTYWKLVNSNKVFATSSDTKEGFLDEKFTAGVGLTATISNGAAGELITFDLDADASQIDYDDTAAQLGASNAQEAIDALKVLIDQVFASEAPVNLTASTISGTASAGSVLISMTGTWSGAAPLTFTYQWLSNGATIVGETNNTYTTIAGDVGNTITCRVTATNGFGSDNSTSNSIVVTTAVAAPNITASVSGLTAVKGVPITGITMTSTGGTVDNYTISPAISSGLTFSTVTGTISGTPTATASAVNYTVTAHNVAGTNDTSVSVSVEAVLLTDVSIGSVRSVTLGLGTSHTSIVYMPDGRAQKIVNLNSGTNAQAAAVDYGVDWWSAKTQSGIGSDYEIFATLTSSIAGSGNETLTGPALDTWHFLSVSNKWIAEDSSNNTAGEASYKLTVSIRDAATQTVIDSHVVTLSPTLIITA